MYSVVIATFNNNSTIIDALDSICFQLTEHDELLIVNDCSKDNTYELLSKYRDYINPVFDFRIINNPFQLGLASSLNIAIQLATQPLIVRMDADDICLPNRLTLQKSLFDLYPEIDILSNSFISFASNSELENLRSISHATLCKYVEQPIQVAKNSLAFQNLLAHPTTVLRREIFNELMYNSSYIKSQDYKCWLDASRLGYSLYHSQQPVLFYRSSFNPTKNISQSLYSIRARLSLLNPRYPLFTFFLIFGIIYNSLQILRLISHK